VRIGKTAQPNGVRVKLWLIEAWEADTRIGGTPSESPAKPALRLRPGRNLADDEAAARLKTWGV
jgi:hypothetical protein